MQYKEFSRIIKLSRIEKGITQKAFALQLGLGQSHYCKIENGELEPSFLYLCKIIKALGINLNELLSKEKTQYPRNYD